MKRSSAFTLLCVAAITTVAFRCSVGPLSAGNSSSETTNGYAVGALYNSDDSPVLHAKVSLIPVLYDPVADPAIPDSMSDTTDFLGRYTLKTGIAGDYNIQAVNPKNGERVLITSITIGKNDTAAVVAGTFSPPGLIKIELPDYFDRLNGYLYLRGTTLKASVLDGYAVIDSVPAGFIPALNYASSSDATKDRIVKESFMMPSGAAITIADYSSWTYSGRLYVNTTASGAGISGTVVNFPVLVRLDNSSFNFSLARSGGVDLRFAKRDNTPLPFEIARWDAVNGQAEIWVLVDTIYGNDNTRWFTVFWGNPDVSSKSRSSAVFDTGNGYQGVWHLDESGNSATGGYADATANNYRQTGSATMAVSGSGSGAIGGAARFSGDSTFIEGPAPAAIAGTNSFTVMFWMNHNQMPLRSWVLYFGGYQTELQMCHFLIRPGDTAQFGISGGPAVPESLAQNIFSLSGTAGVWSLVTTVYDQSAGTLTSYINGAAVDARPVSAPAIAPSGGMHIGQKSPNHSVDAGFTGMLDELQISSTPRTADWVRLTYMNQKAGSTLLRFGK